ncbi:MAG: phage portal protein [Firmicutes bacterium]|nr:phage portal protein [Bacillota bacterium]
MGIFSKAFGNVKNETYTLTDTDSWIGLFGGGVTSSGETVTKESAMTISSVYACTNIIANSVSKLPCHVYKKKKDGNERINNDIAYLLETRPNQYMTPSTFKHTLVTKLLLDGNAYVWIEYKIGKILNLWILNNVTIQQDTVTGKITYQANLNNKLYTFSSDEIIHIKGLATDGITGKSKIDVLRETIGNMQSSRKLMGNYFKNGTTTGGVITYPEKMNSNTKNTIRNEWQKNNAGYENSGKVAILDLGLEYKEINNIKFADQQFLESTKFTLEEIARVFQVPLHMVGDLDRSTFNNIEQQSLDFYMNTILPLLLQIEEEFNYKLFASYQRNQGYYIKYNMEGALRGDSKTRAEYYEKMMNNGVYSINEVRKLENLNSIGEAGDKYYRSLNYVNVDKMDEYQLNKAGGGE